MVRRGMGERESQWVMIAGQVPELTAGDVCEHPRCPAQAFVRVVLAVGSRWVTIDLCGHHYAGHEASLLLCGVCLGCVDARERINARPAGRL